MTAKVLMLQGTGSDVGKSTLVAAICRHAHCQGIRVAPFKAQNMSNNAAVCDGGGEIGRAQALQARAAGVPPHTDMNPVLLKPESDTAAQVVVQGTVLGRREAAAYFQESQSLLPPILESFHRLCEAYELVIVEGAGSAAEANLRARDVANMGFATAAGVPVCLVGDIDRGGVIASVVGTRAVLSPEDALHVRGFLINKFRGDARLFDDGMRFMEEQTGWPSLGLVPWLSAAARLPAEDAVVLQRAVIPGEGALRIRAPMLSRLANFDDADPLGAEADVDFQWVPPGQPIPKDTDVIALFGTKSTAGDLAFLRKQGWDHDILSHARNGGRVIGLCGGYQMLGGSVRDTTGVDGEIGEVSGLGLLEIETSMQPTKTVRQVQGQCAIGGHPVQGYEIHVGESVGSDRQRPMLIIDGKPEGARNRTGRIEGSYVHGLFSNDGFRRDWLARSGMALTSVHDYEASVDEALDAIAHQLAEHVPMEGLLELAEPPGWRPG